MTWELDLCWIKGGPEWNTLSWSEPSYSWVGHHLIHKKIYNKGQWLFCDTFNQPYT